jgi:hypothetical protein
MKQLCKFISIKAFATVMFLSLLQTLSFGQDGGSNSVTSTTHTETQTWYMQPWVWVIGGAVFVLLLVALLRGGGKTDRVSVTKTTTTDTDI